MCDTCVKLEEKIKQFKNSDKKLFMENDMKKREHLMLQREHRDYEQKIRGLSKIDPRIHTVNTDHMAKKFFIKKKNYGKEDFKTSSQFKILPGGHFLSKTGQSQYYLTTELYGETSNTILSECDDLIRPLLASDAREIFFVMDNHSTNKNYVVLCYFDMLVFFTFFIFLLFLLIHFNRSD